MLREKEEIDLKEEEHISLKVARKASLNNSCILMDGSILDW